jgi:hypothetical protein
VPQGEQQRDDIGWLAEPKSRFEFIERHAVNLPLAHRQSNRKEIDGLVRATLL